MENKKQEELKEQREDVSLCDFLLPVFVTMAVSFGGNLYREHKERINPEIPARILMTNETEKVVCKSYGGNPVYLEVRENGN